MPLTKDHPLSSSSKMLYSVPESEVCKLHKSHRLTKHCETCELQVCEACVYEKHSKHQVIDLAEYTLKVSKDLKEMIQTSW